MLGVARKVDIGNKILAALPQSEFERFSQHLENVHLKRGEVVYVQGDRARFVYFPIKGLFSLVSATEDGSTVELAMCGTEGMIGVSAINKMGTVPYEVDVRIATDALRIKATVLREEFDRDGQLKDLMFGYISMLVVEIAQSSICHRFHRIEEALSRWLLAVQDRIDSDTLELTQEIISEVLGVPRTGVTMAAGSLQRAGLIRYSRGKIVIIDRVGLERRSCECYRVIRDEVKQFPEALTTTLNGF